MSLHRTALACGLAVAFASAPAMGVETRWDFRVLLDGSPIGHHRFVLTGEGAERDLTSEARFTVKVLGITAYRYAHGAAERWRDGCIAALTAQTDDNGERLAVRAMRDGDRLTVIGPRGRETHAGCVRTFAYWDPAILREARLLNAQTGEYEHVRVTRLGEETLTVRGVPTAATRYRIAGAKEPIELWYSSRAEWLQLESNVSGGRRLRYQLQ